MLNQKDCLKCKGRLWCGKKSCPLLNRFKRHKTAVEKIRDREIQGASPPSLFVTWTNYPNVSLAPMSPAGQFGETNFLDDPEEWFGKSSDEIIGYRESLIRSDTKFNVWEAKDPSYKMADIQSLAMAKNSVDVDIQLKNKPLYKLDFSSTSMPVGPRAILEEFKITDNVKVDRKVERLVGDSDAKSRVAMDELYDNNRGQKIHSLYKLLSAGLLGVQKARRLVPTRWAITAVDSNISKGLVEEKIKYLQQLGQIELFHSKYYDNDFWIMLIPGEWNFEVLECWLPGGVWTSEEKDVRIIQDHEFYEGQKGYASNVTGAYYSAKLAVAEYLLERKRQASVVVFREIGSKYDIPLGVWVIRETVRNAMEDKGMVFGEMSLAFHFLKQKLKVGIDRYKKESKVLDKVLHQKKLFDWN